jgi:predicted ATPase/DNA-binding CsgD family transcriptional regulator
VASPGSRTRSRFRWCGIRNGDYLFLVELSAAAEAVPGVHGFPAALTSFVGRAREVDEVTSRIGQHRLVTVTGPAGAGKTRLAGVLATRVAGWFADGAWLASLAAVRDPDEVAVAVAAALGIREVPAHAAAQALARALARRQLLLVLDNCEHVIDGAAGLCGAVLLGADDVRVLATSREPLRIAGESRYRLGPLAPAPAGRGPLDSEAVALFADRARMADPGFTLDDHTGPAVARLTARLDGMPLAIELAAARVESLGVTQLLAGMDDRFELLADADRLAEERQRSLAAAVRWSYELLDPDERRVFRAVSVFPGPFTLDGAVAVADAVSVEAAVARRAVPRLVDCSMLAPPRTGPDGRSRYAMLETLRAYGAGLLARAGEDHPARAALATFAAQAAEEAATGLATRTWELAGVRHLAAEDANLSGALAWALEHDRDMALRLALSQVPWWQIRGQMPGRAAVLAEVVGHADPGGDAWCAVHMALGRAAAESVDPAGALEHFTAVHDALGDPSRPESPAGHRLLTVCLAGRSSALLALGRSAEAADDARRSLAMARAAGYPTITALALACLATAAWRAGDRDGAIELVRQARRIPDEVSGAAYRALTLVLARLLAAVGDLAAAEPVADGGLASCREVGDLGNLSGLLWARTILDLQAGRLADAAEHVHEQLQVFEQTGMRSSLIMGLDCCAHLCSAGGRPAEAVTVWAAMSALVGPRPFPFGALAPERRDELLGDALRSLGPELAAAAEERGAAMSQAAAAEYALLLTAEVPRALPAAAPAIDGAASGNGDAAAGPGRLSQRERELVTLVASGCTDAQIAARLFISVRTVSSHLDRIRDKTGCRRRADITRLALTLGLV